MQIPLLSERGEAESFHIPAPSSSRSMYLPNAMHIPHMLISFILPRPKAFLPPPCVSCTIVHMTIVIFLLAARDVLSVIVTTKIGESAEGHGRTGTVIAGELLGV